MSFFPEFLIWLQMEIKFHLNHIECYRINSSHSVFLFFRLIRFFYQWLKCARHFIVHKLKYFYHRTNRVIVLGRDIMCGRSEWWHSSGIEGNPTVFYRLMPGSTSQTNKFHTFYLQQRPDNGDTWADIKVNHPLDYESIKEYNLTIRVEVSHFFLFIFFFTFFAQNHIWNSSYGAKFYWMNNCSSLIIPSKHAFSSGILNYPITISLINPNEKINSPHLNIIHHITFDA